MRLPVAILASLAVCFLAPSFFSRWQKWLNGRALGKARRRLVSDAFRATFLSLDPNTHEPMDLRAAEGDQAAFAIESGRAGFAVLMQMGSTDVYFTRSAILTVPAGKRAYFTFDNGEPVLWLPPKLRPGEIRFGGLGRLYYALVSSSLESLEALLAAEKMGRWNGIPAETLEGIPLSVVSS